MTKAKDTFDEIKAKKDELTTLVDSKEFKKGNLRGDVREDGKSVGIWRVQGDGFILEVKESEAADLAAWLVDMFS